ncbi:MAG: UDP-glucose 4-epimerase GalE [Desulfovibrio sp.]|nr:UDP-glucose 4-epimerase GalE [Desulfovibrio sp.]
MKILVTGGAGYIGSHTCKLLAHSGHEVVVYDNLSTGHREMVKWGPLVEGDIRDIPSLLSAIDRHEPDGIIHFASSIAVGESVQDPGKYYDNNVTGSLAIMRALREAGIRPLVVSGSAAVYGMPDAVPIPETAPLAPINPYGRTKYVMEMMLGDFAAAHSLPWVSLRYFNAAGADPDGETGEWHEPETHLIPNVLRAVRGEIPALRLFGDDYPTPDGTCIRDYVHVADLARAHMLAMRYLLDGGAPLAMNLGSGRGISIREILSAARAATGRDVPYAIEGRRPGDPPMLVADASRAAEVLGWRTQHSTVDEIMRTAWRWLNR